MRPMFVGWLLFALAACGTQPEDKTGPEGKAGSEPWWSRIEATNAGLCRGAETERTVDKVDLLFMIDNSNSMAQEQASLRAQFPRLMRVLTTGKRGPDDPNAFPPVTDLHVGVVSSDMGIPGVHFGQGSNCSPDGGDDGRLQHVGRLAGCQGVYPAFLSFNADSSSAEQLSADFACIAALGTGGCGFEQQLEAPLKALWPSVVLDAQGEPVDPNPITFLSTTFEGRLGRGDVPPERGGNAGFLRNDATSGGPSLIAIVVVTDEDDCSVSSTEALRPPQQYAADSPYARQDINLRCHYNPRLKYDLDRYLHGFRALRPGNPQLVVFAAIAGVPADLVDADARSDLDLSDSESRAAFYGRILSDPRMQEAVDPTTHPDMGTGNLVPSCTRIDADGQTAVAYPPRRIVELAERFGSNGMVQSICQDDFTPAMDGVVDMMAHRLSAPCAP